ncbi:hypothetical protein PMI26_05980 [Pseudomonas sp. GM33]|nr:hypothetical protein PMI26_05980 [Pseudomonas sp. GM33]
MGTGLLAKAVYQPTSMLAVMTPSRASSLPQGGWVYATSASNRNHCGSLLAIAVGQPTPMLAVMTPSRASSLPQGLVGVRNICQQPGLLWEIARDSGGSANINAGCNDAIASKLAPTGVGGCTQNLPATGITVGASLLAIAVGQPTQILAVMTPSRASSLPQGVVGVRNICGQPGLLWERACSRRRWVSQHQC